jgi:hypothetical protein
LASPLRNYQITLKWNKITIDTVVPVRTQSQRHRQVQIDPEMMAG